MLIPPQDSARNLLSLVFENVEASVIVCDVEQTFPIHEHVAGLNDLGALGSRIEHLLWRWRNEESHLFGSERVFHIEDAHARVLVGGEDDLRTLEAVGAILVQVMRTEVSTLCTVVFLRRCREGRDSDRVGRLAYVDYPGVFDLVGAIVRDALVSNNGELAIGQGETGMCSAAEGRAPVAMGDQLRLRGIADVEEGEAAIAPGAIRRRAGDN